MKTLDEVIKANECCDHGEPDSRCEDCPYNGIGSCCLERENDALFYLKEYRFAVENCADVLAEKYPSENVPLTWDELKQMEGKPVWIDSVPLVRRWVIIKKFHPIGGNHNLFDMEVADGAHFLRKSMGRDTGAWWQAYRKERQNVQS